MVDKLISEAKRILEGQHVPGTANPEEHEANARKFGKMSDDNRDQAEFHRQEQAKYSKFTTLHAHHKELADMHHKLSGKYALLSGLHQDLHNEWKRK